VPTVFIGLVAGLITGISPCVLPVLPAIFFGGASTAGDTAAGRRRPYLVVLGLTLSFAVFTLVGSLLLTLLHLPAGLIRWAGLIVLVLLGIGLLVPRIGDLWDRPFARFPQPGLRRDRGGFLLGVALGAVFVPCAGPVLAAITVAGATGQISAHVLVLTISFAVGTAIPLLLLALAGREMTSRIRAVQRRQLLIRRISGIVMIGLAVLLTFNISDVIQRDIPDYAQKLEQQLQPRTAPSGGGSLKDCQFRLEYGAQQGLTECGPAPGFPGITGWLNTPGNRPITPAALKGKVVLVDFWAYSCINCQRELPHAEAWAKTYQSDGLVVIGVHTPEYSFEQVPANVAAGARRLHLTFPVALDNDYRTWNAFDNQSWPAAYLIDANGHIRHVSIGEGSYGEEEQLIRQLLQSAHPGVQLPAPTQVADTTPQGLGQTPELYLGTERSQGYAGQEPYRTGTGQFSIPAQLNPNVYALGGTWRLGQESITSGRDARLGLNFHAAKVYLDVGGTGTLTVSTPTGTRRLQVSGPPDIYTVASHPEARSEIITIELSPGLMAYSFTFG
jgi:cytochrome c biogenesis protein CcdA/thiol-disulfide isomerase/thioredoxin